ncbi:uncharacterized protein EV420DRAFT_1197395 [Desarmillaria tabescens]|uniref:F-box domain-containing protein n=1 Tax=Armillaria tabescens TaxID=1929756 RepID=A0AA39NBJ1_ARMTA|nr:uncharacterized protein EV420DRAFT_1197395 [Desarmillaria tabescens]KAK0462590.1 hypothetical protein EV420DRAFT_1197395 [Desarmillaria tabescens]
MAESLPQELIDAIIDEVHSPSDLRACSLTSRAFSSRTRAILFRHIKLKGSQLNSDGVQKLHELCMAFPHIPPLVQTLCVNGHRGSSTFLAVFDIISCILQFMQNLKVLKFDHVTIGNFCDESLAQLSTHSFREIHLINVIFHENGFEQLCAVLQRSPGLERLLVHHTHSVSMIGGGTTTHLKLDHLPILSKRSWRRKPAPCLLKNYDRLNSLFTRPPTSSISLESSN